MFGCADDDDFGQAERYRDVMSATDREHSVANIVGHASDGVTETIQQRVIAYWASVDAHLGTRVATGLGMGNGDRPPGDAAGVVAARANRA